MLDNQPINSFLHNVDSGNDNDFVDDNDNNLVAMVGDAMSSTAQARSSSEAEDSVTDRSFTVSGSSSTVTGSPTQQ